MLRKVLLGSLLVLGSFSNHYCSRNSTSYVKDYDIVILNGKVIDPESDLDAIRNIGIREGSVQLITTKQITGQTTINAQGLVVAPGFIDMHQHGQDQLLQGHLFMLYISQVWDLVLHPGCFR